jgi:hypothetical protein
MSLDFSTYSGSQAIITSDRVINHSKKEGIHLFGKSTVGISSPGTVNIDSDKGIFLASDKVELGHEASTNGDQVVLGNKLVGVLSSVLEGLSYLSLVLSKANGTTQEATAISLALMADAGSKLTETITQAVTDLETVLSKTTYTT